MIDLFTGAKTAGADATVTVPLLDSTGAALPTPVAMEWRLLTEEEVAIQDWAAISPGLISQSELTISVPGALNTLLDDAIYGTRVVELRVTLSGGAVTVLSATYAIERSAKLIFMVNSFGTMMQLQIAAQTMRSDEVLYFDGAAEEDRVRALLAAHRAIMDMPLIALDDSGGEIGWLGEMDAATRRAKVGRTMLGDLRRAQVLAASDALGLPGDPAMQARMSGIVSMTVGESSQFFGTSKPLEMSISKAAVRVLGRYLRHSKRIGRA